MPEERRAVLLGAPDHFQIRGGANPHTRDRWGRKKQVDVPRALRQWRNLAGRLVERGVRVFVMPADASHPGLVFPANAGFLTRLDERIPLDQKTFYLSRALPTRAAERALFGDVLRGLGFVTADFPLRFEGEADLFPAGDVFLFTSGRLERQRFVPRFGWPPYRRVYGFRSDPAALPEVQRLVDRPVIPLTLVRETHYHGDTCLCSFGSNREFLMVYAPALSPDSLTRLKTSFKDRLLLLSNDDGENFAANAWPLPGRRPTLFIPDRASPALLSQIRDRGVDPVPVDVSEFLDKGGGSVKCLLADLGPIDEDVPVEESVRAFRSLHRWDLSKGRRLEGAA